MSHFLSQILWLHFIVGLALCLLGWTLYWMSLNLAGGCLGATVAGTLCWMGGVMAKTPSQQLPWLVGIGALVGMLLGIFFARRLHRWFFFTTGAFLGLSLGWYVFTWSQTYGKDFLEAHNLLLDPFILKLLCTTIGSLLCGVLMLIGSRWIVSALTSLVGSVLIAISIHDPLALLSIPPVALASFLMQIGVLRRLMPESNKEEDE